MDTIHHNYPTMVSQYSWKSWWVIHRHEQLHSTGEQIQLTLFCWIVGSSITTDQGTHSVWHWLSTPHLSEKSSPWFHVFAWGLIFLDVSNDAAQCQKSPEQRVERSSEDSCWSPLWLLQMMVGHASGSPEALHKLRLNNWSFVTLNNHYLAIGLSLEN